MLPCTPFFFRRYCIIVTSFTYVSSPGPAPVTVIFTDTSQGGPTSWLWNFGDGQFSDLQDPVHVYAEAGIYTVSLNAYIPSGTTFPAKNPVSALWRDGSGFTDAIAYANFLSAPFLGGDPFGVNSYFLDHIAFGDFVYFTQKITYNPDLTGEGGRILILFISYEALPDIIASGAKMSLGGAFRELPDGDSYIIADISSFAGTSPTFEIIDILDYPLLPIPGVGSGSGWSEQNLFIESIGVSEGDTSTQILNIAVDWCGLGWIAISREVVTLSPTEKNLVVETDKQAHLFANYMLEKSPKKIVWKKKYGMPYRCYPHYDLSYVGYVEQEELSDTIIHTFPIHNMPPSPTLNIVLSGTQCGELIASRSPLIEVDSVFV